jgi:hypothetical protein
MKPVEQFMQEFFTERDQFQWKDYDLFGGAPDPQVEGERLESARIFGSFAVANTRIDGDRHYVRHRYRLRPTGEAWIIEKISYQCGRCRGPGKNPDTGKDGVKCKGEGWV